jgi:RNA polymerase sigma factor (sigma-70 family)
VLHVGAPGGAHSVRDHLNSQFGARPSRSCPIDRSALALHSRIDLTGLGRAATEQPECLRAIQCVDGASGVRPLKVDPEGVESGVGRVAGLFDLYGPGLLRFLRQQVEPAAAEDLVSETFVIVVEQIDRFDSSRGSERSWIYGIARNCLRHHVRQRRRKLLAHERYGNGDGGLDLVVDDLADRVDASIEVRQLATALSALSDDDRDLILLTAWSEMTSAEIARMLGIPPGTVRSRLHRVRQELRVAALRVLPPTDIERGRQP